MSGVVKVSMVVVIAACLAFVAPRTAAAQSHRVDDVRVDSLHRAEPGWTVQTSIYLFAHDTGEGTVAIEIKTPPKKGTLTPGALFPTAADAIGQFFMYEPQVGFQGTDTFEYIAKVGNVESNKGTVTIDVATRGLRWGISLSGSSSLTSEPDSDEPGKDPAKAVGTIGGNFMFHLNWQLKSPTNAVSKPAEDEEISNPVVPKSGFERTSNTGLDKLASRIRINTSFFAGFRSLPVASELAEIELPGASPDTTANAADETAESPPSEEVPAITSQQAISVGGELDVGVLTSTDGQGAQAEFAAVASAGFDSFVSPDQFVVKDGVTFVNLGSQADQAAFFRWEAGGRFRLSQLTEDPNSVLIMSGGDDKLKAVRPTNLQDLLIIELVYQKNRALEGLLPAEGAFSENRYVFRFLAFPTLPQTPRVPFVFGVEINRDFDGGPQDVRFFYGAGVNLAGLF